MNITKFLDAKDDWILSYYPSRINVRTFEPEPSYKFNEYVADNPITMMEAVMEDNLLAVARSLAPEQPDPVREFLVRRFQSPGKSWKLYNDCLYSSRFYVFVTGVKTVSLDDLKMIGQLEEAIVAPMDEEGGETDDDFKFFSCDRNL